MYDASEKFNRLKGKRDAVILGIESSCDETAAAVSVGLNVKSNVIASQIEIHKRFGGVVPEIASRNHTMAVCGVVDEALRQANMRLTDVDAVAVTYGAGLIGALLVGVSTAKALAMSCDLPLIKVNHVEAHICANYIAHPELQPPFLALVASGGHTSIIQVQGYNEYSLVGSTTDDAIGEAFDKVARLLGLEYPGGPNIDRLSKAGKAVIDFYKHKKTVDKDNRLSYSGLKTAVVNYVHGKKQKGEEIPVADVCASFTVSAVDLLADTVMQAAQRCNASTIVLAGGVASNSYLRSKMGECTQRAGCRLLMPSPALCTDNAAMVAVRGFLSAYEGANLAALDLNPVSNLRIGGGNL